MHLRHHFVYPPSNRQPHHELNKVQASSAIGSATLGSNASGSSGSDSLRIKSIISESRKLGLTDDEPLFQQPTCHSYGADFTNSECNLESYRPALDGDFYDQ
ncbi:hypothetical protein CDES_04230 [Corynebacterium deserti GIMN1.010]|uniref:Uncharacterized protein n=1 Tax=Corynebacterium deserti GIMN1.010 TaxID=931089 RepID=A0A0M4CNX0_9CORY|nr:hypothetical protein CDES_04230 [Corynebacterium deserti GIMN1.010]